ncbi:MAG: type II toxin-antitoxin system HigB family toxin [Victivallales bacterium]|jgi:mRNA interferase HigB|nr:type II toxin-antitoxin system HigB family toxin [Victivallales bacterium]MBT7299941.1 type II toxin-antitoxin system HigB family toxin [Victivallales bacterium]
MPHIVQYLADFLQTNRVVFNIGGNKYRLVVQIAYKVGIVYVRFVGTHREYDRIDAESV